MVPVSSCVPSVTATVAVGFRRQHLAHMADVKKQEMQNLWSEQQWTLRGVVHFCSFTEPVACDPPLLLNTHTHTRHTKDVTSWYFVFVTFCSWGPNTHTLYFPNHLFLTPSHKWNPSLRLLSLPDLNYLFTSVNPCPQTAPTPHLSPSAPLSFPTQQA